MSRFGSKFASMVSTPGVRDAGGNARPAAQNSYFPSRTQPAPIEYAGYVENIRIFNDWAIGKFFVNGKSISIKGSAVAELKEGTEYRLTGRMVNHPKYGDSFDVISSAPYVQLDPRAIQKYLVDNFKGIGEKTAKKMVDQIAKDGELELEKFRVKVLDEPWSIDWSTVGREGVYESAEEDSIGYIGRDLATRIGNIQGIHRGILKGLATFLFKKKAAISNSDKTITPMDAWNILKEDPYEPARTVAGYGFRTADAVGSFLNIQKNEPSRLRALIHHALEETCNSTGHVFLTSDQLAAAAKKIDPRVDVDSAIDFGVEEGMIIAEDTDDGVHYYTPKLYLAEVKVARGIRDLMEKSTPLYKGKGELSDEAIQTAFRMGKKGAPPADASQVAAVRSMLTNPSRLHILTGGPGCGKTALIETVIRLLTNSSFQFCAPTGKAAKVLTSRIHATGHSALTIHSLFKGSEGGWRVNSDDPLIGDLLVVDESSMPSLELWEAILDGMNKNMHIILAGDQGQLPSIQAGAVLIDLLKVKAINHVHLSEVHRNSGGILDVVNEVSAGHIITKDRESVKFSHGLGDAEDEFSSVVDRYITCAGRSGLENTLLLMSRRQGKEDEPGWNTTYANAILREVCNPGAQRIPGTRIHVGDRIIIKNNMVLPQKNAEGDEDDARTERVVNGDTGTIRSFEESKDKKNAGVTWMSIRLDDGRIIDYPGAESNHLQHSYALTVHAAQGSEYKDVLAVFTPGTPSFVNRNMLKTALSRARDGLEIFAKDAVLKQIAATPLPQRNSALVERITQEEDYSEDESPRIAHVA
jgi:exodeoxyribonuclease V alpha subunit